MKRNARKKYHLLYKTTCIVTNKFYIGMHSTDKVDDGYLGSGKMLNRSIKKYGSNNHVRTILEMCKTRELLVKREEEVINGDMLNDPLCMNLTHGGKGGAQPGEKNSFFGKHHSQETIERIRNSMKGEKGPCFGRCGELHPLFGKKHTDKAREKMSRAHAGKPWTTKQRNAICAERSERFKRINHERDEKIINLVVNQRVKRSEVARILKINSAIVYKVIHRYNQTNLDCNQRTENNEDLVKVYEKPI